MNHISGLKVAEVSGAVDEVNWDRYVLEHPLASGYHLLAWRRIIEEIFAHRTFYLMAKDSEGVVQGVLPLVFLSSWIFGRFLISMPCFNYGGLLADTTEAREALLIVAVELAKDLKAAHIELRHQELIYLGWQSKRQKVSMRLDLPMNFDVLWKGFSSKLRSQIRRAQKEGMVVRMGGGELLEDFYRVFSRNMRDLGTPVYSKILFKSIVQTFPNRARICVVYWKDRPLAAGFLYGFRRTLEIPWASSDRRYNHLAPNMLLYSSVLEHACQESYKVFDFGRSTTDSGTYQFKKQWGAKPVQLYWQYWVKGGEPYPELNVQNSKYRSAIKVWQNLPVALTRMVGPFVVKNLP